MTVGDVVNGVFPLSGTWYVFQPAAGIEVLITCASGQSLIYAGLTDGVTNSYTGMNATDGISGNIKFGITNTIYLKVHGSTTAPSFSGIQIK